MTASFVRHGRPGLEIGDLNGRGIDVAAGAAEQRLAERETNVRVIERVDTGRLEAAHPRLQRHAAAGSQRHVHRRGTGTAEPGRAERVNQIDHLPLLGAEQKIPRRRIGLARAPGC